MLLHECAPGGVVALSKVNACALHGFAGTPCQATISCPQNLAAPDTDPASLQTGLANAVQRRNSGAWLQLNQPVPDAGLGAEVLV
jgi:hypothetical protein